MRRSLLSFFGTQPLPNGLSKKKTVWGCCFGGYLRMPSKSFWRESTRSCSGQCGVYILWHRKDPLATALPHARLTTGPCCHSSCLQEQICNHCFRPLSSHSTRESTNLSSLPSFRNSFTTTHANYLCLFLQLSHLHLDFFFSTLFTHKWNLTGFSKHWIVLN